MDQVSWIRPGLPEPIVTMECLFWERRTICSARKKVKAEMDFSSWPFFLFVTSLPLWALQTKSLTSKISPSNKEFSASSPFKQRVWSLFALQTMSLKPLRPSSLGILYNLESSTAHYDRPLGSERIAFSQFGHLLLQPLKLTLGDRPDEGAQLAPICKALE